MLFRDMRVRSLGGEFDRAKHWVRPKFHLRSIASFPVAKHTAWGQAAGIITPTKILVPYLHSLHDIHTITLKAKATNIIENGMSSEATPSKVPTTYRR